jgi:hypothetical protein
MLNLLRLRDVADYSDYPELAPTEPISGSDAYQRYLRHTEPFLAATGGRVLLFGSGGHNFGNAGYLAGMGHRVAAVEDTRLPPIVLDAPT